MAKWKITLDFTDYHGNEKEDIANCLNTLYSTPVGTAVLDRDFGLNWDVVDLPLPVAINRLVIEITEKTERYEPRVQVEDVICETSPLEGIIQAKVVLKDGY